MDAIGLAGVSKTFVRKRQRIDALKEVSLVMAEGEVFGFVGPNGAGKSTTIKMLTGILVPSSGEVRVAGRVPWTQRVDHVRGIGVVFGQRTNLWWDLPVIESLDLLRHVYRVPDDRYERNLSEFRDLLGLSDFINTPVRSLSLGQRMRADLAGALLHDPRILFLDEPTIGLDVAIKSKIRAVIKQLNEEQHTTIILTTHDLHDVEALCQRIIIIDKGKIIYDGSLREVTELFGAYRTLKVQIFGFNDETPEALRAKLAARFGTQVTIKIEHTEPGWTDVTINQDEVLLLDVLSCLMAEFAVKDIRVVEMSVENVVQRIYEGALK